MPLYGFGRGLDKGSYARALRPGQRGGAPAPGGAFSPAPQPAPASPRPATWTGPEAAVSRPLPPFAQFVQEALKPPQAIVQQAMGTFATLQAPPQQSGLFSLYRQALATRPASRQAPPPPPPLEGSETGALEWGGEKAPPQQFTGGPQQEYSDVAYGAAKARGLTVHADGSVTDDEGNEYYWNNYANHWMKKEGAPDKLVEQGEQTTGNPPPQAGGSSPETQEAAPELEPEPSDQPTGQMTDQGNGVYTDETGKQWVLIDGKFYEYGSAGAIAAQEKSQKQADIEAKVESELADLEGPADVDDFISPEDQAAYLQSVEEQTTAASEAAQADLEAKMSSAGLSGAGGTYVAGEKSISTSMQKLKNETIAQAQLQWQIGANQMKLDKAKAILETYGQMLSLEQQQQLQEQINTLTADNNTLQNKVEGMNAIFAYFTGMENQDDPVSPEDQAKIIETFYAYGGDMDAAEKALAEYGG